MRKVALLSLVMLFFGAARGFAQDVRYNFEKDADYSKYKTYKWVSIKGSDKLNDLAEKQITAALDAELATKGLTKTDSESADLYIGYQTAIGSEKQFSSYTSGWGSGPGWGGGWYGGAGSTTTSGSTSIIYVGQLDLDMYDSAKKELVWRGTVSKTIDPKAKPDKQQKNITKSVQKLLKTIPPSRSSQSSPAGLD